jgi:hypothetical protein
MKNLDFSLKFNLLNDLVFTLYVQVCGPLRRPSSRGLDALQQLLFLEFFAVVPVEFGGHYAIEGLWERLYLFTFEFIVDYVGVALHTHVAPGRNQAFALRIILDSKVLVELAFEVAVSPGLRRILGGAKDFLGRQAGIVSDLKVSFGLNPLFRLYLQMRLQGILDIIV